MELKGYTNIPDWMLSLDLDVYETIILAIIFGFSQDGESTFAGSLKYLCQKAKCSRRKVTMVLPRLVQKGLIVKTDKEVRGVRLCEYRVSPLCMGSACGAPGGSACGAPNNIDNENIDNNSLYKKGSTRFQKPAIEEIRQYCRDKGYNVDAEQFYNFYESKGWVVGKSPMKNWRAAVSTWSKREKEIPQRKRETRSESVLEHNLKVMDQMYGSDMHSQAYGKKEAYDEQ